MSSLPAAAADLYGGYSFRADCSLGYDVLFYVPASAAVGCLTLDESGCLFNISNSTIYLYCPDHPDYTISASRFSPFYVRESTTYGSDTYELVANNIKTDNVEIFYEDPEIDPELSVGFLELLHVMLDAASFAVAFILLLKWGDKHV